MRWDRGFRRSSPWACKKWVQQSPIFGLRADVHGMESSLDRSLAVTALNDDDCD